MNDKISQTFTRPQRDIFFGGDATNNVVPKGRRFGATRGAAHACIEWAVQGQPILWGDTIRGNIIRYWDRYFKPSLDANGIKENLNKETMVASIGTLGGYIDFRSADRPENWEGFGYKKIILNEAGIILNDPYLYTNAVRPMMMDPGGQAQLFALGVPKGKMLRNGQPHPFHVLWQRVENGEVGYRGKTYTSYDNGLLDPEDIRQLEADMSGMDAAQVRQEIYGEFIDRVSGTLFAFAFDRARHVGKTEVRPNDLHYFSLDFNVEPFTAILGQQWTDAGGAHMRVNAEAEIKEASIKAMSAWIIERCPMRHLIRITGDRGGLSRAIGYSGPVRLFNELKKELRISDSQFEVPANPKHIVSREEVNYTLANHPDLIIDSSCTRLIADLGLVEVDASGSILKADRSQAAQRADHLDCLRYYINTYIRAWINQSRR